jgi:sensor histidine kinase YesM
VPKENGGKVIVSINEKDGGVECVIDDNGIGRELSKQHEAQYKATHQSNGIGLTQTRLDLAKFLNEREDSITIIDKKNESGEPGGTKVIISFKENRN